MSEASALKELNRLGRLLMEPVKGYDSIGGFHIKKQRLILRHLDCDEEWIIQIVDSMLQFFKNSDTDKALVVEFDGFGRPDTKRPAYDFVDVLGVLIFLRKNLILDTLARV